MKTLLIGYGNPDRQDDGVAWHILNGIASNIGLHPSPSWEDSLPSTSEVDLRFELQLTPEMLLSMCESLYHKVPEAILPSLRGYKFGFETDLSPFTASLVPEAVERTVGWLCAKKTTTIHNYYSTE
jgi:Ni,Fe-hydrogenase maturation factor